MRNERGRFFPWGFAWLLYTRLHGRDESRRRTLFPRAAGAASLARAHGLPRADGILRLGLAFNGRGVPVDGRMAGVRLLRPRRARALSRLPPQLPRRARARGGVGVAH